MKKTFTILVMLLIAATAYDQTSRRPANSNKTAQRSNRETSDTRKSTTTRSTQKQASNTIAKTKPADRRTYHYDQNTPVRNTATYSRSSTKAQQNSDNTAATTSGHNNTSSSRKDVDRTGNRMERSSKNANTTNYRKAGYSRNVNTTHNTTHYHEYESPRVYRERHSVVHHYHHQPASKVYRAKHYAYRRPVEISIIWTPAMHRHYIRMYPMVKYWYYPSGYRIALISSYDAEYYRGEVRTVYGQISEVFYSRATDEYFLYYGLYYPYQDFTVVLPGYIARNYSHQPERYFYQRHLAVTGLITTYNGEPEIVVKESFQINLY